MRLENRLKDINNNDQGLEDKATYLEKDNILLKKKLAKIQAELAAEKDELGNQIEELQTELRSTRNELMEMERAKKELESELITNSTGRTSKTGEISEGIEMMKQNFDKQMKIVKRQLELKDQKIKEKEEEITRLDEQLNEAQVQIKKMDFTKNRASSIFEQLSDDDLRRKNEELELKLLNKEEEYMDRIEALEKEIEALKMQVISSAPRISSGKGGDEMELAALSVENQKLRKALKELQSKGGGSGSMSSRGGAVEDGVLFRENEMLKRKNKELEDDKQKVTDELIKLKVLKFKKKNIY